MKISKKMQQRLDKLKKRLEQYEEAEEKILNAQAYTMGSRSLTRADLPYVQKMIQSLEDEIDLLETRGTTGRRAARLVPMDW